MISSVHDGIGRYMSDSYAGLCEYYADSSRSRKLSDVKEFKRDGGFAVVAPLEQYYSNNSRTGFDTICENTPSDNPRDQHFLEMYSRICNEYKILSVIHEKGFVDLFYIAESLIRADPTGVHDTIKVWAPIYTRDLSIGISGAIDTNDNYSFIHKSKSAYVEIYFKKHPGYICNTETQAFVRAKCMELISIHRALLGPECDFAKEYEPEEARERAEFKYGYELRSRIHTFNGLECTFEIGV